VQANGAQGAPQGRRFLTIDVNMRNWISSGQQFSDLGHTQRGNGFEVR
jgi:hypothetical protein